jgi:hypothetical protein
VQSTLRADDIPSLWMVAAETCGARRSVRGGDDGDGDDRDDRDGDGDDLDDRDDRDDDGDGDGDRGDDDDRDGGKRITRSAR